jgi:glycosyltransferase involved in cell wall biosynthesis
VRVLEIFLSFFIRKIIMVTFCHYWGGRGHTSHTRLMELIGANFVDFYRLYKKRWITKDALIKLLNDDLFISEGMNPMFLLYFIKLLNRKKKIIALFADGMPYVFSEKPKWYFEESGGIKRFMKKVYVGFFSSKLFDKIDAGIAVSKLEKEYVLRMNPDIKVEIAYPYITSEKYNELTKVTPNLETHIIFTIADRRAYKGVDLLLDAFRIVKEEIKDAELLIRGSGFNYPRLEAVKFLDRIPNLSIIFRKSSLYVQPSRFDPFPVSVLESMLSGVPPVVTNMVGSKEAVEELGEDFIRDVRADDIAEGILRYFDLSLSQKKRISKKCRELAMKFDEETCIKKFRRTFFEIVEYLER